MGNKKIGMRGALSRIFYVRLGSVNPFTYKTGGSLMTTQYSLEQRFN